MTLQPVNPRAQSIPNLFDAHNPTICKLIQRINVTWPPHLVGCKIPHLSLVLLCSLFAYNPIYMVESHAEKRPWIQDGSFEWVPTNRGLLWRCPFVVSALGAKLRWLKCWVSCPATPSSSAVMYTAVHVWLLVYMMHILLFALLGKIVINRQRRAYRQGVRKFVTRRWHHVGRKRSDFEVARIIYIFGRILVAHIVHTHTHIWCLINLCMRVWGTKVWTQ